MSKKGKHRWKYGKDEYAECRICKDCNFKQYVYGDTKGKILFWLPEMIRYR